VIKPWNLHQRKLKSPIIMNQISKIKNKKKIFKRIKKVATQLNFMLVVDITSWARLNVFVSKKKEVKVTLGFLKK
jgi:hypothetical protein